MQSTTLENEVPVEKSQDAEVLTGPIGDVEELEDDDAQDDEQVVDFAAMMRSLFGMPDEAVPVRQFIAEHREALAARQARRQAQVERLAAYHQTLYEDEAFDPELSDIVARAGDALETQKDQLDASDGIALAILDLMDAAASGSEITPEMQAQFHRIGGLASVALKLNA